MPTIQKTTCNVKSVFLAVVLIIFCVITHLRITILEEHQLKLGMVHKTVNDKHISTSAAASTWHKPKRTLIVKLIGGLGNHLFLYASTYGIAKKTNRAPIVCFEYDIRKLFSNITIPFYTNEECNKRQIMPKTTLHLNQQNSHLYYDIQTISLLKASKNPFASICCYLQNLGFFYEYEKEIKSQFIIHSNLQAVAHKYLHRVLKKVASKNNTTLSVGGGNQPLINGILPIFVAVHIRRGNILNETTIAQPGPVYFKMAMNYYRHKYGSSVIFSVATDDVAWAKANLTGTDIYYTRSQSREREFAIAVACNHTVISVGTFGWWMGYLSGGDVVYYRDFALKSWVKWFNAGQFFPYNWKGL